MADIQGRVAGKGLRRYKDMGDGTHAGVEAAIISRDRDTVTVTIENGEALSDTIDFRDMAAAFLHMPAAWTAADIGFYASPTGVAGSFTPVYENDTRIEITGVAASRTLLVPAEMFPGHYVQLWSQNAGVDENQGADRAITLSLKG